MNVFLINDTSDDSNWGARATSNALRQLIEENGGTIQNAMYSRELAFSSQKANQARKPESINKAVDLLVPPLIPKVIRRVGNLLSGPDSDSVPSEWDEFETFATRFINGDIFPEINEAISNNDLVIINGEGCIYGLKRESRLIYFLAYVSKKYFRKPTAIVNHTADLTEPRLLKMAKNVYPILDDVVFRESVSARNCGECGKSVVAADASFIYKPMQYEDWIKTASRPGYFDVFPNKTYGFDPSRPYICVGGSSTFLRKETRDFDPVPGYLKLIKELKNDVSQIVLTASAATDEEVMRPISRKYKIPMIGLHTPVRQLIDILGNARVYIGGRWHPSIFALSGGTPVVPLSAFTFKMNALMNDIGLDVPVINSLELEDETEKILKINRSHLENGEALRRFLKRKSDRYAIKARRNVGLLSTWSRSLMAM